MKSPCCVENGYDCPNTSSCSMILRSACSNRHFHRSLMVNAVQAQPNTHRKRKYTRKKTEDVVSRTDSSKRAFQLESVLETSLKQLAWKSTKTLSAFKENLYNSCEFFRKKKAEFIQSDEQIYRHVRDLHFSETSTSITSPYLNSSICISSLNNKSGGKGNFNLAACSETMPRTRSTQRAPLRALSGSETDEESSYHESTSVNLRKSRTSVELSKLNSSTNRIDTMNASTNLNGASKHSAAAMGYSRSALRSSAVHSCTNLAFNTPTGIYAMNQSMSSPEMSVLDRSVVQYTMFDRFRWLLWRYVYLQIIRTMNFDVWLLSRPLKQKFRAVLLLLLPFLFYLLYTIFQDPEVVEKSYNHVTSAFSTIYSFISQSRVQSSKILEKEYSESSCRAVEYILPSFSGISSFLSRFWVKSEESAAISKSSSQTFDPHYAPPARDVQNIEQIKSMIAEVLEARFEDLEKRMLSDIQQNGRDGKIEISELKHQFQTVSRNIDGIHAESTLNIDSLNDKLKTFELKLESLSTIKRCCDEKWTPADFMVSLEKHLMEAFKSVVDGDKNIDTPYYFFNEWLNSKFIDPKRLASEIDLALKSIHTQQKASETKQDTQEVVETVVQGYMQSLKKNLTLTTTVNWESLSADATKKIVKEAIMLYDADKTGLVDYALESGGGSVLGTRCSESYVEKNGKFSIFGLPLWTGQKSPRTAIQPNIQPGECWAFKGSQGFLVIELSYTIRPTGFTLEHIPVSLSPTGSIDSAPKEFSVWGLATEYDNEGALLGKFSYDVNGEPLQYFAVENLIPEPFSYVELKIHSNHGNMEYTCLYRFRVHGTRGT